MPGPIVSRRHDRGRIDHAVLAARRIQRTRAEQHGHRHAALTAEEDYVREWVRRAQARAARLHRQILEELAS